MLNFLWIRMSSWSWAGWHPDLLVQWSRCYNYSNLYQVLELIDHIYSKARHRLDGVVYAVKITKKKPKRNSRDEKVHIYRHEPSLVEIPVYFVFFNTLGGSQWSFCPCCYDEAQTRSEVSIFSCLLQYKKLEELFSRYFNAWVESGHLHIQTEFCEGGSLEAKVRLNFFKLLRA